MKAYKIPQIRLSYVADVSTDTKRINTSSVSADLFRASYEEGEMDYREFFKVMYLNRALKPLGIQTISMGGSSSTIVDTKMIFTGALLANARASFCATIIRAAISGRVHRMTCLQEGLSKQASCLTFL